MSLFAAPLYALAFYLPFDLGLTQTTLLTSSLVIALTGALVFLAARRLQFSRGVSIIAALLFGLATPAWVYAKQFWSEPYSPVHSFRRVLFFDAIPRREPRARRVHRGNRAGTCCGDTRDECRARSVVSVVRLCAHVGATARAAWRWCGSSLALTFFALSIAWYDWARYGNPLATGYRADETFDNPILLGTLRLALQSGQRLVRLRSISRRARVFCADVFSPRASRSDLQHFAFRVLRFTFLGMVLLVGWHQLGSALSRADDSVSRFAERARDRTRRSQRQTNCLPRCLPRCAR